MWPTNLRCLLWPFTAKPASPGLGLVSQLAAVEGGVLDEGCVFAVSNGDLSFVHTW